MSASGNCASIVFICARTLRVGALAARRVRATPAAASSRGRCRDCWRRGRQYPTPVVSVPAMRGAEKNAVSTTSLQSDIKIDSVKTELQQNSKSTVTTPGSLPKSANELSKPAKALIMRLMEKDPKVRLRNLRQLQQTAFYLGFNFEHVKAKKVSPKRVFEDVVKMNPSHLISRNTNIQQFLGFDQESLL